MSKYPSIFNDVIGPVMRGPSSSHCAASLRIGRLCRDLVDEQIKDILIEFDPNGSLATTHKSQGSDMGLFGGFLGWEAFDERLPQSEKHIITAGINVTINIVDIGNSHPNLYKITLQNSKETRKLTAISTGGGMIEVTAIDEVPVSMAGDYFETLIYCEEPVNIITFLKASIPYDDIEFHEGEKSFIEIKSQAFLDETIYKELLSMEDVSFIKQLQPVLPVMARKNLAVPFITCNEMLEYNAGKNKSLWELAVDYEMARGNITATEVFEKMRGIIQIMGNAIELGLKGTHYDDRILGSQSLQFKEKLEANHLIGGETNNRIILYVSAMMEVKSSMGVIVAAPTAGSCGALPGALFGTAHSMQLHEDELVKAMLSAGLIGVFIAAHATFAAEVGGCMAETGSGGGMAAAAIVEMKGGTLQQALAASSLALQNSLGIICDPIGNRVEAPCLGSPDETGSGRDTSGVGDLVGDDPGTAGPVVRVGAGEPDGSTGTGERDERAASAGEPVQETETLVTSGPVYDVAGHSELVAAVAVAYPEADAGWCAPSEAVYDLPVPVSPDAIHLPQAVRGGIRHPSPIEFPAPVDPETADRIEATAAQVQETFPYRTLLDCRTIAAQLVDAVLTWDAEWPEAEGDCGCGIIGGNIPHMPSCIWSTL